MVMMAMGLVVDEEKAGRWTWTRDYEDDNTNDDEGGARSEDEDEEANGDDANAEDVKQSAKNFCRQNPRQLSVTYDSASLPPAADHKFP